MEMMIGIFFAAVIIVGLLLMVMMGMGRKTNKKIDKEQYKKDWDAIMASINSDNHTQQFAIIQADKLLDKALKESGYAGSTMAERMTSASRVFSQREAVWTAHKLRNRIAHENHAKINPQWVKKALSSFKRGLKDLGAL